MTYVDIAVIVAVAVVIGGPYLYSVLPPMTSLWPAKAIEEDYQRNEWVQRLLELQSELEQDGQDNAVKLCRNLIWELLGGGPVK